jgi:hypothetical protein
MGIRGLIQQKYAIQQQGADAEMIRARAVADLSRAQGANQRADANLSRTRADLLPGQSAAEIALRQAQAAGITDTMARARTEEFDPFSPDRGLAAERFAGATRTGAATRAQEFDLMLGLRGAQRTAAGLGAYDPDTPNIAPVSLPPQQGPFSTTVTTMPRPAAPPPAPNSLAPTLPTLPSLGAPRPLPPGVDPRTLDTSRWSNQERARFGFAKGTARVPGKGSGKVDTVPAMLAPGEAVLNKGAAETIGRGLIAKANAAGARKMGMV